MSYLESLEKRIATIENWQKVELVMLAAILGERAVQIALPLISG